MTIGRPLANTQVYLLDRHLRPVPSGATIVPRDALELALVDIWEELLGQRVASVQHSFFAMGGHSLLAVRLLARIEQSFGVQLPLALLYEEGTIAGIAAHLRRGRLVSRPRILLPLRRGLSPQPLFLVHPISGLAICYHDVARALHHPVYGIQAPTIETGQPPHAKVEEMAADYVAAIRAVQERGPYLLGGWSFGGIVAFEMARQLETAGEPVEVVIIFDTIAPGQGDGRWDVPMILCLFLRELTERFGVESQLSEEQLSAIAPERQLVAVLEEAKRIGGLPQDAEVVALQRMVAVCEASMRDR